MVLSEELSILESCRIDRNLQWNRAGSVRQHGSCVNLTVTVGGSNTAKVYKVVNLCCYKFAIVKTRTVVGGVCIDGTGRVCQQPIKSCNAVAF